MTDTCSCPPGACHGGHTIDVGPAWVCLTDEQLRQRRDDPDVCVDAWTRSMAAELLALRARVTELEAERGRLHTDRMQADARTIAAEGALDRIRHALAQHPRCDRHPDDDAIRCGWQRAVASVQWALDHASARLEIDQATSPAGWALARISTADSDRVVYVVDDGMVYQDREVAEWRRATSDEDLVLVVLREVGE